MAEPAPLGLLGGTFDPIHYGHLRLAEEAREALGLSGLCWIPAGQPPHRAAPRQVNAHNYYKDKLRTFELKARMRN